MVLHALKSFIKAKEAFATLSHSNFNNYSSPGINAYVVVLFLTFLNSYIPQGYS